MTRWFWARAAFQAAGVLMLILLSPAAALAAQAEEAEPGPPLAPEVRGMRVLVRGGARPDWAVQGDLIAFDRRGPDDRYDAYVARPDGTGERCLTCPHPQLRTSHVVSPAWHPSGEYLAFQAQEPARRLGLDAAALTTPDRGLHSEIWIISRDGRSVWQVTRAEHTAGAVLDPRFSYEGGLLLWSERVESREGRWGRWALRLGRFTERAGTPRVRKVETVRLGETGRFVQAQGFTPDETGLLVSGNLDPGLPESGLDLYLFDLDGGRLTNLTRTPGEYDGEARFSPDGESIAWTSSRGVEDGGPRIGQVDRPPSARAMPRELWIMAADGSDPRRLTFFNHPESPGGGRPAVVSGLAWSPDGHRIALHAVTDLESGEEAIYLLDLRLQPRR